MKCEAVAFNTLSTAKRSAGGGATV